MTPFITYNNLNALKHCLKKQRREVYPSPSMTGVLSGAPQGQVLILKEVTSSYSKKARRTTLGRKCVPLSIDLFAGYMSHL